MRSSLLAMGFTLPLVASACVIESNVTPARVASSSGERQVADDYDDGYHEDQGPGSSGGEYGHGTAPGGPAMAYNPDCRNPGNHCLDDEIVFTATRGFENVRRELQASIQEGPPDGAGEARFMVRRGGEARVTQHYWTSRPAQAEELQVGRFVIYFLDDTADGRLNGPPDRDKAHTGRWALSRVLSIDPVSNGYVLVNGINRGRTDSVTLSNVRVLEGDDSPVAVLQGPEDAHFLRNHYFGIDQFPQGTRRAAQVLAPIQEPSAATQGEGHFVDTSNGGSIGWTGDAYRTAPATAENVRVGQYIVYFGSNQQGGLMQAPESRSSALVQNWYVSRVIDDSRLFRGMVQVAGINRSRTDEVSIEAARVIIDAPPQAALDAEATTMTARAGD
jgi:hypothetical protein